MSVEILRCSLTKNEPRKAEPKYKTRHVEAMTPLICDETFIEISKSMRVQCNMIGIIQLWRAFDTKPLKTIHVFYNMTDSIQVR